MKAYKLRILLCFALTFSMAVHATQPVPADFAYGTTIETDGEASLWEINLPEDVYRKVVRPDLGDIRVFDASGQVMPHTIRRPRATIKEPPAPMSLPVFPLYRSDNNKSAGHSLHIVTDDKGAIVNAIRESIHTDKEDVISSYLIDVTQIEQKPDKLILDWESSKVTGFSVNVNIDVSDDLSSWHRLVHKATLADLRFEEHHLSRREIDIPVRYYKYLRISWPIDLREVRLKNVVAAFPASEKLPQRNWIKITGVKNQEPPISYDFDSRGYWPVDRARIILPPHNIVINAELESRPDEKFVWYRRYRGLFYRLLQDDGTMLTSSPVSFRTTSDRYWQIVEIGGGNVLDRYTPVLELGWMPHILTFVAQGEPPYVIAFGSGSAEPLNQTRYPMSLNFTEMQQRLMIKTTTTSESYLLGGIEKLEPPPEPLPWRTWLLWAVLITGVVLLGWMVWRLSRQMNQSSNDQD